MFSHVQLGARDLSRMIRFYDDVLAELGLKRAGNVDDIAGAIWKKAGQRWPQFVVSVPYNGLPATWGNGCQISFAARSPDAVASAWSVALACGGYDEGEPGIRPLYNEDFYGAYCRDPEGNKLSFVFAGGLSDSFRGI